MGKRTGISPVRLLKDYKSLVSMSKDISLIRENVRNLEKTIARISRRTDLGEGAIDQLEDVSMHLSRSKKELDRASGKLKLI